MLDVTSRADFAALLLICDINFVTVSLRPLRSARKAVRSDLAEFIASSVTAEMASLPLATESRTGESASLNPPRKFSSPVAPKGSDSGFDPRCCIAFILWFGDILGHDFESRRPIDCR